MKERVEKEVKALVPDSVPVKVVAPHERKCVSRGCSPRLLLGSAPRHSAAFASSASSGEWPDAASLTLR